MDLALNTTEIISLVIGLGLASIIAGILAGLLGVGGGIVIVPALFWLFTVIRFNPEIAMHVAVATSLATIIATSVSSMRAHHRKGAVDFALLKSWAPWIAIGAFTGGILARFIDPAGLKSLFGVIAFAVAINLAIPKTLVVADGLPVRRFSQGLIATVIGLFSSLMGIGGGTLSVPTLAAFSYPIHRAVGTASAFGLVIAVPAVIGFVISGWNVTDLPFASVGYVNLVAVAIILPFTTVFAPVGARLAHRLNPMWVKRAFAFFLAITALRMFSSAVS